MFDARLFPACTASEWWQTANKLVEFVSFIKIDKEKKKKENYILKSKFSCQLGLGLSRY